MGKIWRSGVFLAFFFTGASGSSGLGDGGSVSLPDNAILSSISISILVSNSILILLILDQSFRSRSSRSTSSSSPRFGVGGVAQSCFGLVGGLIVALALALVDGLLLFMGCQVLALVGVLPLGWHGE